VAAAVEEPNGTKRAISEGRKLFVCVPMMEKPSMAKVCAPAATGKSHMLVATANSPAVETEMRLSLLTAVAEERSCRRVTAVHVQPTAPRMPR